MAEVKLTLTQKILSALKRLARIGIAQLPALIAWLTSQTADPKLVALGVLLNAVSKFLREMYPSLNWLPV